MATPRPEQQSEIKQLISKGLEQGYLTYAEVNDHLPDDVVDPEQIEDIIGMINSMGIEVHEVAPDAETLLLTDATSTREADETAAEEAAAALTALDAEGGRTTDPVRMYMREMGTVELLTREGEIAIAKRIEEGLHQVQNSLAAFPWTIQIILDDYALHQEGKKRLSEIVTGFADLETPELFGGDPIEAAADEEERLLQSVDALRAFVTAETRSFAQAAWTAEEQRLADLLKRKPWLKYQVQADEESAEVTGDEAVDIISSAAGDAFSSAHADGLLARRKCLYETLGLSRWTSSESEFKAAYTPSPLNKKTENPARVWSFLISLKLFGLSFKRSPAIQDLISNLRVSYLLGEGVYGRCV